MGLTSGDSGGGENLPKLAIFCFVMSITITLLTSVLFPIANYEGETPSAQAVDEAQRSIALFSGQSAINYVGWDFEGAYTPYDSTLGGASGASQGVDGWLYASDVSSWYDADSNGVYSRGHVGTNSPIYLNPEQKSTVDLTYSSISDTVTERQSGLGGSWNRFWGNVFGDDSSGYVDVTYSYNYWSFTGWRYVFTPVSAINAFDTTSQNVTLSLIWYDGGLAGESLQAGFVLYGTSGDDVWEIGQITADTIVNNYGNDGYATRYQFTFQNNTVYAFIKFDDSVINTVGTIDWDRAFSEGKWSLQIASPTVANLFSGDSSISTAGSTMGNLLTSFVSILTLSNPEIPSPWSIVVWLFIVVPADLGIIMFTSRFGVAGAVVGGIAGIATAILTLL